MARSSTEGVERDPATGRRIRLTHLDGSLPNLALMRLAAWHRSQGDTIHFSRSPARQLGEPDYDVVFASAIFSSSAPLVARLRASWPGAIVGGTWEDRRGASGEDLNPRVEHFVPGAFAGLDYSLYPRFASSIGYSMRGCRFRCGFCRVPGLEGRPNGFSPIEAIWRGPGHPRHLHLLDNDFFASPEWPDRIGEVREGGFRVCFSQGLNVRVISDAQAAALASIQYRDTSFRRRRLYTAWDNLGHERVFFRGVDRLEAHGIPPVHLMAYSLVGWSPTETWEGIWHRHRRMAERGIKPYVMVHEDARSRPPDGNAPTWATLKRFQRWTNLGLYRIVPWDEYDPARTARRRRALPGPDLFTWAAGVA